MNQKSVFLVCFLLSVAMNGVAQVYQCRDSRGLTEFRDSPCSDDQTTVNTVNTSVVNIDYGDASGNPSYASEENANLIRNGTFERETAFWRLPEKAVRWSRDEGVGGSGALIMNADLPPDDQYIHDTKVEQCVLLNGSAQYVLSVRILLEKTPKKPLAHRANVIWYRSEDCSKWGTFGGYIEPKGSTGRQTMISPPMKPTMDAVAAKIELVQKGKYSNQGKSVWDDVQFRGEGFMAFKLPQERPMVEGNFVTNGSFSEELEGWKGAYGAEWSRVVGNVLAGSVRTTMRSKKNSKGAGVLYQCVQLGRAKRLNLGSHVKIDQLNSSQKGGGRLRVTWYESPECAGKYQAGRKHADIEPIEGWQKLLVQGLEVPAKATSAKVQLIQSIAGPGVFVINWDDVFLEAEK